MKATLVLLGILITLSMPFAPHAAEPLFGGIDLADVWVRSGAQEYYRIFGHWPTSWQAVTDAKLVQVPLRTVFGLPVNPDDGSLDHPFDIQYVVSNNGANASIAKLIDTGTLRKTEITAIENPGTYAELFEDIEGEQYQEALGSTGRLTQLSIANLCNRSMMFYSHVHGDLPATWQELVSSGLFPIDANSLNPLTGSRFAGDGSPNDLKLIHRDSPDAVSNVFVVDDSGNTSWGLFF
ncbi:hypothetical protein IT575_03010 [bacterium]|nr:hypothetical protein [bacterium]